MPREANDLVEELAAQLEEHEHLAIFMDPGDGNLQHFNITDVIYDVVNDTVQVEITPDV